MSELRLVLPSGRVVSFDRESIRIGSDPACEVVLDDPSVARRHATIERQPQGWVATDRASATGMFVDGERVTQQVLRTGQELRLGSARLSVAAAEGGDVAPPRGVASDLEALRAVADPDGAAARHPGEEAATAARLGIWPGAAAEEVLHRYESLCQELQERLDGARSPADAAAVERELAGMRTACIALLRRAKP